MIPEQFPDHDPRTEEAAPVILEQFPDHDPRTEEAAPVIREQEEEERWRMPRVDKAPYSISTAHNIHCCGAQRLLWTRGWNDPPSR